MAKTSPSSERRRTSVIAAIVIDIVVLPFIPNVLFAYGFADYGSHESKVDALGLWGLIILAVVPWIVCIHVFDKNPAPRRKSGDPPKGWLRP